MRTCEIDGCEAIHKGRGLCNMHLLRLRHTGTTDSPVVPEPARFWAKVNKNGPAHPTIPELGNCWVWTAATNDAGYGVMRPAGQRSGPCIRAHRYSAQLAGMDIDGLEVLHSCDIRPCVNPAHLRPGTDADNMQDARERNRIPLGSERKMAKLTESQVREIKSLLASGALHKDIAHKFGVSRPTITCIHTGVTWRHVTPPAARDLIMIGTESLVAA